MTIDEVHEDFRIAWSEKPFDFAPGVVDRVLEADAALGSQTSPLPYTLERERRMLADLGRHLVEILHRRAAEVRAAGPLIFADGDVNWVCEAIEGNRIQAQVCRLLGLMGSSAQVRPDERLRLGAEGFSERDVDAVDASVRRHARHESRRDWFIGPERQVLVHHLGAENIEPTDANLRRLRANALCLMADLMERTGDRYTVPPIHVSNVATHILSEPDLPDRTPSKPSMRMSASSQASEESADAILPKAVEETEAQASAVDSRPPASFIELTESLIRRNTALKTRCWDDKTARQHLSTAKLFVKVAGTDDPRLMTQVHIGEFTDIFSTLPTHWGKSSADAERSLDEIKARAEDLDDEEIGLSAPTIKRHRIELSALLAHAAANGYVIGKLSDKPPKDSRPPSEKRRPFTADEGRTIIAASPWTLSDPLSPSSHPKLSATDAQFWVFPLCWHMLMRLGEACGIMVADVDLKTNEIMIRHNKLRRIKNNSSIRPIPIPPEIQRLGFMEFVLQQKALGHEARFPELHGHSTAATVVFNKRWIQVLDLALPNARAQCQTMHSTRKGGNGAMLEGDIKDSVRYYILGHAPKDVHGRHYMPAPSKEKILEALACIPDITATLPTLQA